jgi:HEAT repeat protein
VALSTEPNHPPVFALLARTRNLAADDALVTALPRMEPALRATALTVLLERDRDPALAGVVAHYGTVDADLDTMLRGHAERLSAGVRLCMASEQFEVRRSAVELIRASESGKLAYLLSEALKQPCRKTAQFAAETLAMLTDEAIANPRESASSRTALARGPMDYLVAALQNALASWPMHFRPEVVLAAARLARALERIILTQAEDPRVNVARAFNNAISGSRDPRLAGYCLRALRSGPLRVAAGNLLADTRDPDFRAALVDEAWVLADDAVRRSCSRVKRIGCLRDDADVLAEAQAGRGRQAVRLVAAFGGRSGQRLQLLRKLAISGNSAVARSAMWALINHDTDETTELLRGLYARRDVPLREITGLVLRRRTNPRGPLNRPVSPGGSVAGLDTSGPAAPVSAFAPYWEAFDDLSPSSRVSIGASVAEGCLEFADALRAEFAKGGAAERLRALKIIQALNLAREFAEEIYAAAVDAENVIRSLAMSLLGSLRTATSKRLLRAALDDSDDRVQANAIEALEMLGIGDVTPQVFDKLSSNTSRVRANAVKALMHLGIREGARALIGMLGSEVSSDRFSALWVIEHLRLQRMLARIERLTREDPDERVRNRARRVLRQLRDSATVSTAAGQPVGKVPSATTEGRR